MLAAILDFSVRHHLFQFMPAVSETTENVEHFGIWHILLYGGVRVHNFSVLKVTLPTVKNVRMFYGKITGNQLPEPVPLLEPYAE